RWGAALAASAALAAVCGGAQAQNAAGEWRGTINDAFGSRTVGVTLKAKAGGGYEGVWVTPKATVPLKEAKVDKGTLTFSSTLGSYSGHWDRARKAWVGQWAPQLTMMFLPPGAAPPQGAPPPGAPSPGAQPAGGPLPGGLRP